MKKSKIDLSQATIVVAVSGPKGAGKTHLSKYAVDNLGAKNIVSFAKKLKEFAGRYFDLNDEELYGKDKEKPFDNMRTTNEKTIRTLIKEMFNDVSGLGIEHDFNPYGVAINKLPRALGKTPRQVLQVLGTEIIQSVYKPYSPLMAVCSIKNEKGVYFIDDLRFPLEDELCKKHLTYYYPIRIIGRNENNNDSHISESAWKDIQFFGTIDNSGTIEQFHNNSVELFKKIKADVMEKVEKSCQLGPEATQESALPIGKGTLGRPGRVPVRW